MKCPIHNAEMDYGGENGFGDDIWYCDECIAEEEAEFQRTSDDDDEPFDDFLLDEDDELLDDGVYEGDVVIHQPYDDEED